MFETNNTPTREVMAIKHLDASQLARISRRNRQSQVANEDREIEGESQTDTGISIAEADVVLTSLVREGFFEKHGKDSVYYSLAPRALLRRRITTRMQLGSGIVRGAAKSSRLGSDVTIASVA
jgi:hypothetical protein